MPETIGLQKKASTVCAVFKIDFRGRLVYIDDETEELFGFGREELFGKSLYEFIAPDSIDSIDEILKRRKRYESFYESLTLVLRLNSGEYRTFESVVTLNFITGNPVNFQFILLPGSSGKQIEQVEYQNELLDLLNANPDDIDGARLTSLLAQTAGYHEAHCYQTQSNGNLEIVASWPDDIPSRVAPAYLNQFLVNELNRFSFVDADRELCDGFGDGKSEAVLFFNRSQSHNLIVHLYGSTGFKPVRQRLEMIQSFCGIWKQRTALTDATNSIGQQMSFLGQAGDAVGLATLISNSSGEILYHNTSFGKLTPKQKSPDQSGTAKQFFDSLHLLDENDRPVEFSELADQAKRSEDLNSFSNYASAVGQLYLATGITKINDEELQISFILPEAALKVSSHLNSGPKTNDLLAVAHDLNAPLITIESFARHLQKKLDGQLSKDDSFAISSIIENSSTLSKMLEGLKEISSFRASTDPCEKIALPEIIKQMVKALRAAYPDTRYEVAIEKELPSINAPRHKIERILRNLLDNSFKYSASVKTPRITITAKTTDDLFTLELSDNGPGIEAEYQTKIYEPFFRCPDSMVLPGTGIGLAIARDISQSLGGDLTLADSKSGAKFLLSLPKSILDINPIEGSG